MIFKTLGSAVCASSLLLAGGCGILETVELPEIRFDSNSYVVQPGDTLQSVADRYSLDPQVLGSANALDASQLVPGQRLLLVRQDGAAVRSNQALVPQSRRVDDQPVAMIPSAGQDPQFTEVNDQAVAVGPVVVVPPREQIIAVREPASSDALLNDLTPVEVAELPTAPGVVQPLNDTAVINDVVVATGDEVRPGGTETVIQNVSATASDTSVVEIPAADVVQVADAAPAVRTVTVNTRADGWNWPALGQITREFDLREINRQGLDIDAGPGAGVQAAADGEVVYSGRDLASYGNLVILRHEGNFLSAYSKVSDIFVKENQKVKAGDLIAVVGSEATEGTELHFEIRRNGEPVNPVDYLPAL